MNRNHYVFWICASTLTFSLLFFSCKPDDPVTGTDKAPKLPATPYDYSLKLPPNFSNPVQPGNFFTVDPITGDTSFFVVDFVDNFGFGFGFNAKNPQITDKGATLGRVLFYDPKLSVNNAISCSSCHNQSLAFSDGRAASLGFGGKTTPRNSMAILNAAFNNNLFWDSREQSVKDLVTRPIQNHIEMGVEDMATLVNKLGKVDYYKNLFAQAYGTEQITEERLANALSQFVCSITSTDARFDKESANNFAGFTQLEQMGRGLFFSARTNCSACHAEPNFAAPDFVGGTYGDGGTLAVSEGDPKGTANNGLDLVYKDQGLGNGKFRIPSLRNIALTAPYMHDGRFNTLEEVVEHYSKGIQNHPKLDKNLRNADGSPLRPNLNALESKALVAFLHTLTDEKMLTEEKYSNPFK